MVAAVAVAIGCAAPGQPAAQTAEPTSTPAVDPRYLATIPQPEAPEADVDPNALAGAKRFLARELAKTGGVAPAQTDAALPAYVFNTTVRDMQPDPSGRTRASVELVVSTERGGKIVGMLQGAATAYVERSEPLSTRQRKAIEGALAGALQRLPQLLHRLEGERAPRAQAGAPAL